MQELKIIWHKICDTPGKFLVMSWDFCIGPVSYSVACAIQDTNPGSVISYNG